MKLRICLLGALCGLWIVHAKGALLGVNPAFPKINYNSASALALTYQPTNQTLSITASPATIQFAASEGPRVVSGVKSLQIKVLVDNTGALVGGVTGDDFVLSGTVIRIVGGVTNTYTGVLLTGEVIAFGFLESGVTDQFDFRFQPTGGALLGLFNCGDVAMQVTSESSTFADSFTASFNGRVKGVAGPEDLVAPTIICPPDMIVESQTFAGGLPGAFVSYPLPVVADNCDTNPSITFIPPSGSFFRLPPTGPATNYTIVSIVKDAAGNSNLCTFIVTVQDTLSPQFADTNNPVIESDLIHGLTLTNDPGQCYATFTFARPFAIDNTSLEEIPTIVSAVDANGAIIPLIDLGNGFLQGQFPVTHSGTNIVTVTADDGRGNTSQHQAAIFVIDVEPPVVNCPTNQFIECTNGPVFFEEPTASDNCPSVILTFAPTNGGFLGVGSHSIVATAVDAAGNSNQCSFSVTVRDTTPPAIVCPDNVTIECGQSSEPANTGTAAAADSCDSLPAITFADVVSGACPQTITRTWTTTDASSNSTSCVQLITVQDTAAPMLTGCPTDVTIGNADPLPPPALVSATDDCAGVVPVTFSQTTNNAVVLRVWSAVDPCGNSNSCSQSITRASAGAGGCTRTQGYWKNHPEAWPVESLAAGCVTYTKAQAIAIFQTRPRGDATYILIHQLFAAKLNVLTAANSDCLGSAIADADAFLCAYALGSNPADPARTEGISLATVLDDYNNGRLSCAAHCADDAPSPQPKFNRNDDPFHPDLVNAVANQTVVAGNNGVVSFAVPNATSEYDWNVSVSSTPAPGSVMGPGQHTITVTASDSYGTTTTSNFTLTVLTPLRVVVQSPLTDGNVPGDAIPGADNIANKFKSGQTVVHKVKLYDASGHDVTATAAVTVKLDVVELDSQNPAFSVDLPEDFSGMGDPGGTMVLTGGAYQFNLKTNGYEAGTVNNSRLFLSHITVYYNSAPTVPAGEEDVDLESK